MTTRGAQALRTAPFAAGLLISACIAFWAPSPASSGTYNPGRIDFDLKCYIVGQHPTVNVLGSKFAPGASLVVQIKESESSDLPLQSFPVSADAAGAFTVSVPNPGQDRSVVVGDGSDPGMSLAFATLKAAKFEAGYYDGTPFAKPTRVKSLRVLFGSGFEGGQQDARGTSNFYLHRVAPGGKAKTELISRLRTCGYGGTNRHEGRAMFKGSAPVKPGKWKFQYDTKRKYKSSTKHKVVLRLRVSKGGVVTPREQTRAGKL